MWNGVSMLFSFLSLAQAENLTVSTDHAVALHLSEYGLSNVSEAIKKIFPPNITISAGSGYFECGDNTQLNYELDDTTIYLILDDVGFSTQDNQLYLDIYGTLGSSQSTIFTTGECAIFSDLNGTIAIEWGAYGVPETFLIYDRKIIKKIIGPLNQSLTSEIISLIK